jgi:hypothetical protein
LALASVAWGQNQPVTGNITTASAGAGNCVSTRAQNNSIVGIDVSGTFTGLVLQPTVQISAASGAPTRNKKVQALDGTLQSTITATGAYKATISGWTQFNVCATALSTGSAVVSLYATPAGDNTIYGYSGSTLPWVIAAKCSGGNLGTITSSNKAYIFGFTLTFPLQTSNITYDVTNPDNTSNTYDFAIYQGQPSGTENRLVHLGPTAGTTFAPSNGWKTLAWAEGTTLLPPARYYLMWTSSCTAGGASCAELVDDSTTLMFFFNNSASITTGGTSPATYSSAADSPSTSTAPCLFVN